MKMPKESKGALMKSPTTIPRSFALPGAAAIALIVAGAGFAATIESVTAKIEGRQWTATRSFASATQFGAKPVLSVTAFLDAKTTSHFTFNIFVPAAEKYVGSFAFGQGSALSSTHGAFFAAGGADANPMEDNYSFADGKITIDSYDASAHTVSGTFSGTSKNHVGKKLLVSEGHFSGVAIAAAAAP
jgi:hypothetical protein